MSNILQGDIHRFYLRLQRHCTPAGSRLSDLDHVRAIADFYKNMDPHERRLLLAWAKKEESGIGLIPACLSGVPFLALIFAPFVQGTIKRMVPWVWGMLWCVGAITFIIGIYIHHRQKAYTTLHIQLLEDVCRTETGTAKPLLPPKPFS